MNDNQVKIVTQHLINEFVEANVIPLQGQGTEWRFDCNLPGLDRAKTYRSRDEATRELVTHFTNRVAQNSAIRAAS